MSTFYGIRITVEDEDMPIQEFFDDPEVAMKRKQDLVEYYEAACQNKRTWLMQFGGLTPEQAFAAVKIPEIKIEEIKSEDVER